MAVPTHFKFQHMSGYDKSTLLSVYLHVKAHKLVCM